ncbi:MAG: hypothetical protein ABEJ40_03635 [Haloarculaceae archaeon]
MPPDREHRRQRGETPPRVELSDRTEVAVAVFAFVAASGAFIPAMRLQVGLGALFAASTVGFSLVASR